MFALYHLATMIYQNQVGDANLSEVHPERIHPEMVQSLRIASGDVASHSLVESKRREDAEGGGQPLFPVPALFFCGGKGWRLGQVKNVRRCCRPWMPLKQIGAEYSPAAQGSARVWDRLMWD